MYCYKLKIAYDGTHYSGWQIQPNGSSIQQHIQEALKLILNSHQVVVIGSGRTDAGVHALGQIAHFIHHNEIDLRKTLNSLNGLLPKDIRVFWLELAEAGFHAQYSAKGKEYHYHLYIDRVMDPFKRLYCWHLYQKIDLGRLNQAAAKFIGTHDFTSFANEAHAGCAAKDPIRTLWRLDVTDEPGGVRLEFEGDGFLYKMVRNITGTLVDVASGKLSLDEIDVIFNCRDRRKASSAAPAQGLFLVKVDY